MTTQHTNPIAQAVVNHPRSSVQDALLLAGAMLIAVILCIEYDLFKFDAQLTSDDRRITLAELIFLTALLAAGIAAFILRRLHERRLEEERQVHSELKTQRLRRVAQRDTVTGLFNHRGVLSALKSATITPDKAKHSKTLLLVGVDGIDHVSDIYGRATGEHLLRAVVARFRALTRPSDVLGRLDGGDEFAVLAYDLDHASAQALAQKYIESLRTEILVDQHTHKLGVWVGATMFEGPRRTPSEVLQEADLAMRRAKEVGEPGPVFYSPPSRA